MDLPYPNSDEFDQDTAKHLFEHCAFLIIEELPIGSEFGLDMATFNTGERFKGVKMIPPGIHYYYANAISNDGKQYGPRVGFYHNFQAKEVLVTRWSKTDEDFDETFKPTDEYVTRYSSNLRDLDRYLGAYRYSTYRTYLSLTNKITVDLLNELVPIDKKIRSVPYLVDESKAEPSEKNNPVRRRTLRADGEHPTEENLLTNLVPAKDTNIRFTKIPEKHNQLDITLSPDLVTRFYLDSTLRLRHAFKGRQGRERLLAEFQFAFVTLLMGHVYDCFEQWQKILVLFCSADSALNEAEHQEFCVEFLIILRNQLEHVPEDLFIDITDTNNLIRHQLDNFFQNCHQVQLLNDNLIAETDKLRTMLAQKYGWRFNSDIEDDLPTIAT
jgi:A1 cistron-splicing factor AAR2